MKPIIKRLGIGPLLFAAGLLVGSAATGVAVAATNQPRMYNALQALQTAQSELKAALANKAGHRAKALALIGQAITEVNLGITAGGG